MNDLISVIIPVYNTDAALLNACVNSVLNQTHRQVELLIVDDGSETAAAEECDRLAETDSRISVIHKPNGGVSSARNYGLENAKGDYIAFLDSDDYIDEDMYACMLSDLLQYRADIATCGMVRENIDRDNEPWGSEKDDVLLYNRTEWLRMVGAANGILPVHVGNKLYRRSCIGDVRFNTSYKHAEDTLFNFRVALNSERTVENNVIRYHYVNNELSVTHKPFSENKFSEQSVMDDIFELAKDLDEDTYKYCVFGDVQKTFRSVKQMMSSGNCVEHFPRLRKRLLQHRKIVLRDSLFSVPIKVKMLMIWLCPHFYQWFIKHYDHYTSQ